MTDYRDPESFKRWEAAARTPSPENDDDPLTQALRAACEDGSDIEIVYYGGSTPGRKRRIQPKSIYGVSGYDNAYVEAYCYTHGEVRQFRLDKLSLPGHPRPVTHSSYSYSTPSASSRPASAGSSRSSPCFVATAVFADADHPTVTELRCWRDTFLLHRPWGRMFVSAYYRVGPRLAQAVNRWPSSRPILARILFLLVRLIQRHRY